MKAIKKALNIVIAIMLMIPSFALASKDYEGHWAESVISALIIDGTISGDANGNIHPDDIITRAEFAKVINNTFHFTLKSKENFVDVDLNAWYANEMLIAKANGYFTGDNIGNVNPQNPITREEMCVTLARVLKLDVSDSLTRFIDSSLISDWAKGSVKALINAGYLSGYPDGTFKAKKSTTRAEAFSIIMKYKKSKNIEDPDIKGDIPGMSAIVSGGNGGGGNSRPNPSNGTNKLDEPIITKFDSDETIYWSSVSNADFYELSLRINNGVPKSKTITETKLDLTDFIDEMCAHSRESVFQVEVEVKAKSTKSKYTDSLFSNKYNFTKQYPSLDTPILTTVNKTVGGKNRVVINIQEAEGAVGYFGRFMIGGNENNTLIYDNENKLFIIPDTSVIGDDEAFVEVKALSADGAIIRNSAYAKCSIVDKIIVSDTEEGDGSIDNPYRIRTANDFEVVRKNTDKHFILMNDVNLGEFEPLPNFTGTLITKDNKQFIVSLNISKPDVEYVGLFSKLTAPAKVSNIVIAGNITGAQYTAGVCGYSVGAVIDNCINTANITGASSVGGIIGKAESSSSSLVSNCVNSGEINGHSYIAGIVGYNYIVIENCSNIGKVTGVNTYIGGICGISYKTITSSYNAGEISGKSAVAGITGAVRENKYPITNSFNIGNVSATSYAAGIIGGIWNANSSAAASYCYNAGQITANVAKPIVVDTVGIDVNLFNLTDCFYVDENAIDDGFNNSDPITSEALKNSFDAKTKSLLDNGYEFNGYEYPTIEGNKFMLPGELKVWDFDLDLSGGFINNTIKFTWNSIPHDDVANIEVTIVDNYNFVKIVDAVLLDSTETQYVLNNCKAGNYYEIQVRLLFNNGIYTTSKIFELYTKTNSETIYTNEIMQAPNGAKAILSMVRDDAYTKSAFIYEELNEKYDLVASAAAIVGNEITGVEGIIRNESIWKRFVENGRLQILNHSYNHGWDPDKGFTETPYHAIIESKIKLKEIFPTEEIVSFIEPGGSYMNDESENLIKDNYIALRRSRRGLNSFNPPDWYDIALYGIGTDSRFNSYYNDTDIKDVIELQNDPNNYAKDAIGGIKDAINNGGWLTQMWHGIGDVDANTYAPITTKQAETILKYTGEKKASGELAVMFFTDAVKYLKEYQDSTLNCISSDDTKRVLTLTPSGNLDESITTYNYPLSIKSTIPNHWQAVNVTQNGKSIVVDAITIENEHFVYFNAIPDGTQIILEPSLPTTSSNLSSLCYKLSGNEISVPNFDPETLVYKVELEMDADSEAQIYAQAEDLGATVSMNPSIQVVTLRTGEVSQAFVTVTPIRGATKTYRIDFVVTKKPIIDPEVIFEDDFEYFVNGSIPMTKWNYSIGNGTIGNTPVYFNITSVKDINGRDGKALNMIAGSGTSAIGYDFGDDNVIYTDDKEVVTVEFDFRAGLWTGVLDGEPSSTSAPAQTSVGTGTRFIAGDKNTDHTKTFARIANVTAPATPVQPSLYITPNGAAANAGQPNFDIPNENDWHRLKAVFKAPQDGGVSYDLYVDGAKVNTLPVELSVNPGLQKFMLATTRFSTIVRAINMVDNYKIKKMIPNTSLESLKYSINGEEPIDIEGFDSTANNSSYNVILPNTITEGDVITLIGVANKEGANIIYKQLTLDSSMTGTATVCVDNMSLHSVTFEIEDFVSDIIFEDDFESYPLGNMGVQSDLSLLWNFSIGNGTLGIAPSLFTITSVKDENGKDNKALNMLASSGTSAIGKDFYSDNILYTNEDEAIAVELDFRVGALTKGDGISPGDVQIATNAGTRFIAGNFNVVDSQPFVRIANITKPATGPALQPNLYVTPNGAAANADQYNIEIENDTDWHNLRVLFLAPVDGPVTYDVYVDDVKVNDLPVQLSEESGLQKFILATTRFSTVFRSINFVDNYKIRRIKI